MKRDNDIDIAVLKEKVGRLEEESRKWNTLVKEAIKKIIVFFIMAAGSGWFFGWQLPEAARKTLVGWLTK